MFIKEERTLLFESQGVKGFKVADAERLMEAIKRLPDHEDAVQIYIADNGARGMSCDELYELITDAIQQAT